jgi:hypothetical protein
MKKYFCFITTFFLAITCLGQVEKIKIKKQNDCDYKFIVDASLIGKTVLLKTFSFDGVPSIESDRILEKLRYVESKQLKIIQTSIDKNVKKICSIKELKLYSMTIKRIPQRPNSDTSNVINVNIHFVYSKKL